MAEGRLALNGPAITGPHTTDLVQKEVELKPAAWPRTETDWFSSGLTTIAAADSVTFRVPPTLQTHMKDTYEKALTADWCPATKRRNQIRALSVDQLALSTEVYRYTKADSRHRNWR